MADDTWVYISVEQGWTDDRYVVVSQGKDNKWYWTRWTKRGNLPDEIVANGTEGYNFKHDAMEAARRENPGILTGYAKPEAGDDAAKV